jgi:hypothetical protein
MLDTTTIAKLNNTSIEERISIIEMLLGTLKNDIKKDIFSQNESEMKPEIKVQRPAFGFMKDTGNIIGDVVSPVLDENTWEVLQ